MHVLYCLHYHLSAKAEMTFLPGAASFDFLCSDEVKRHHVNFYRVASTGLTLLGSPHRPALHPVEQWFCERDSHSYLRPSEAV
jgi:hypothetical protein